jgi:hypothetical protein
MHVRARAFHLRQHLLESAAGVVDRGAHDLELFL